MKGRVSCSSSSNTWSSNLSNEILCNHNLSAVIRTVKKGPNVGKIFFGCPLWPNKHFGLFVLMDDIQSESYSEDHEKSS
ncbi:hypothetical protein vseg_017821 [Gypsophila vaccaria]